MLQAVQLKILDKRLGTVFPWPGYATDGAAGLDLMACCSEIIELAPGTCQLIGSGLAVYLSLIHISEPTRPY